MKRNLYACVSLFFLLSCSTTKMNVRMLVPAAQDVGGITTIAVFPFSFSSEAHQADSRGDLLQTRRISFDSSRIATLLSSALVANGHFTVVERADIDKILSEHALSLSGMIEEDQAAKIGRMIGAEGILLGNCHAEVDDGATTEVRYDTVVVEKKRQVKGPAGANVSTITARDTTIRKEIIYRAVRTTSTALTYKVVHAETGRITAANTLRNRSTTRRENRVGEKRALSQLGDPGGSVASCLEGSARYLTADIAPHTVTRRRIIYNGKGDRMKRAREYALNWMWDDARRIWKSVLSDPGDTGRKNRVPARANLALYHEIKGSFDQGADLYKQCYEESGEEEFLSAHRRVLARKEEVRELRKQQGKE